MRAALLDPRAAVYGPSPSLVAYVGRTRTGDSGRALALFKALYDRNAAVDLGTGTSVRSDVPGGAGRCWATTTGGVPVHVCAIAGDGVLFALVDPVEPVDVRQAAVRARAARVATVS